jgi:hypothetical protein
MSFTQDHIQFGTSDPIIIAPYELLNLGDTPMVRVTDPLLYIYIRDILLARQLGVEKPRAAQGQRTCTDTPPDLGPLPQRPTKEAVSQQLMDKMLLAFSKKDLGGAHSVLLELLDYLAKKNEGLRHMLTMYDKLRQREEGNDTEEQSPT